MKAYESGATAQAQKGPQKMSGKPKGFRRKTGRATSNTGSLGKRPAHPSRSGPRSPECETGCPPEGCRIVYRRVPRLPQGVSVVVKPETWVIRLNVKNWKSLWRQCQKHKEAHPVGMLLKRVGI